MSYSKWLRLTCRLCAAPRPAEGCVLLGFRLALMTNLRLGRAAVMRSGCTASESAEPAVCLLDVLIRLLKGLRLDTAQALFAGKTSGFQGCMAKEHPHKYSVRFKFCILIAGCIAD